MPGGGYNPRLWGGCRSQRLQYLHVKGRLGRPAAVYAVKLETVVAPGGGYNSRLRGGFQPSEKPRGGPALGGLPRR